MLIYRGWDISTEALIESSSWFHPGQTTGLRSLKTAVRIPGSDEGNSIGKTILHQCFGDRLRGELWIIQPAFVRFDLLSAFHFGNLEIVYVNLIRRVLVTKFRSRKFWERPKFLPSTFCLTYSSFSNSFGVLDLFGMSRLGLRLWTVSIFRDWRNINESMVLYEVSVSKISVVSAKQTFCHLSAIPSSLPGNCFHLSIYRYCIQRISRDVVVDVLRSPERSRIERLILTHPWLPFCGK